MVFVYYEAMKTRVVSCKSSSRLLSLFSSSFTKGDRRSGLNEQASRLKKLLLSTINKILIDDLSIRIFVINQLLIRPASY